MATIINTRSDIEHNYADGQDGWGTSVNKSLEVIARLGFHPYAINNTLATPPASPANQSVYIVAASPTGAWAGQTNMIAFYNVNAWVFYTPVAGMKFHIQHSDDEWVYNGTKWRPSVWLGTQAQYDALPAADKTASVGTMYLIRAA